MGLPQWNWVEKTVHKAFCKFGDADSFLGHDPSLLISLKKVQM